MIAIRCAVCLGMARGPGMRGFKAPRNSRHQATPCGSTSFPARSPSKNLGEAVEQLLESILGFETRCRASKLAIFQYFSSVLLVNLSDVMLCYGSNVRFLSLWRLKRMSQVPTGWCPSQTEAKRHVSRSGRSFRRSRQGLFRAVASCCCAAVGATCHVAPTPCRWMAQVRCPAASP